ncbi:MAG: hypothetical protein ACI4P5_06250, partial [Candidatus Fimadaptatus sp.]
ENPAYREMAVVEAQRHDWRLREMDDDTRMLRMMVDGTWNEEEFLVLRPGERIAADYTGRKLKAVSANG